MANYYNPYSSVPTWQYGAYQNYGMGQQVSAAPAQANSQYMINVDGEMAARAWQMPNNLAPNTVIPLWDLDGQHVYFRSIDAYGRMNPLRKGHVVFDDEPQQNLVQGQSGAPAPNEFVTKNDLEVLKQEIKEMLQVQPQPSSQTNQNGSKNRGENR